MKKIFVLLAGFMTTACGNVERLDTSQVKEMVKNDKIRKVSEADITTKVNELGATLADSLTNELAKTENCNWETNALLNQLKKEYGLEIRLLGMPDTQNKTLLPKEAEILQAYAYNAENKLSIGSNVQKIDDARILYTTSIKKESGIAEKCFSDNTYYFAIWSIVFSKSEVIKRL